MTDLKDSKIIDGNRISSSVIDEIKNQIETTKVTPGLALILVGNNPASEIYVKRKEMKCKELGYHSVTERLPETAEESQVLELIHKFNSSSEIHGILVQLPLPRHINEMKIIEAVDYRKDVDGFHPVNVGRLVIGQKCFIPCTPYGIYEMLKRSSVETSGRNLVVIGRSNIVGKPVANIMLQKEKHADCTVTICHSATANIREHTLKADIIIAAIGKPEFLKADMIKEGAVIIDVGINKVEDSSSPKGYRICGDVDFRACYAKASKITPVPGGVGPMTIAMLMKNTLDSAMKRVYGKNH
ncbi:MAG: bifunctional 5,10-methylenetetrahydrofolate dehydrogenase/5,10-methenyltetrahydrofolate cyclohydrolase [Ignavibacteria bacterium]|nr:bifunctional 5,10-methylenetetrahydrofolate dehydrogenase/5,10-methenyltetrahydrofolate cyclohydrolase [Ignavibacteria bacterium]